jgi:heme/copper-type cytochrome/quinol oxidase subunit 2
MTWRLDAWDRFAALGYWWMHAMVAVWALFTVILFVAEPLFLHAWFRRRAMRDPEGTAALVLRAHRVLLTVAAVTIVGAVLGAHGLLY